jgi:hypothetical protein
MRFLFLLFIFIFKSMALEHTFIDATHHLEWEDTSHTEDKELIWKMSKSYCQSLHVDAHDDWRLPTLSELDTLVPVAQNRVNGKKLRFSSKSEYWTIDDYKEDDTSAWEIHMDSGHHFYDDKCEKSNVRCVRTLR